MARNTMRLNMTGFNELVTKYEGLGGDVKEIVKRELEKVGHIIGEDTAEAVQPNNLPAKGKFSRRSKPTEKSIIQKPQAQTLGSYIVEIGVGFDFEKEGAGGYLIKGYYQNYHGTPRHMDYDKKLHDMYVGKSYMRKLQRTMQQDVQKEIIKKAEG